MKTYLTGLQGMLEMTGHSVVNPGDTFSVWTDARSRQTRKVVVASSFQGDIVNLTATFQTLASKLTYVSFAEVTVPAKQINLKAQNYDFLKPEPVMASTPPPPPPAHAASAPPPPPTAPAAAAAPPPPPAHSGGHVPIGTVVSALPAGCTATTIGGVQTSSVPRATTIAPRSKETAWCTWPPSREPRPQQGYRSILTHRHRRSWL